MAQQKATQMSEIMESTTVVDADVHLSRAIPWERVCEYLDEPYKSRILETTTTPLPYSGWDRTMGGKIDLSHVYQDQDMLDQKLCKDFGVDYPILNTTSRVPRLPESDLAVHLARAYNDVLLEILDEFDHFRGLVTIQTQKPDKAAEEIDRLADEKQIAGIYISTGGPEKPLGDERYDIMYQAAQDNNMAIGYHGHVDAMISDFARQNQALEKYFSVNTLGHPWMQMLTLTSLIEQGTMEKFPELNFIFMEAGLGWVPYMMYRLNSEYAMRRSELPLLEKSPEEYIRDQCYFTTQPIGEPNNAEHIKHVIKMLGCDSIVFSSDYPHWDYDNPAAVFNQIKPYIDSEELNQITSENAIEAFGLTI